MTVVRRLDPVQRPMDIGWIAHVAANQFDIRMEVIRAIRVDAMYLLRQVVQRSDAMPVAQQFVGKV